jgi:Domain of unknown function (DUF6532)
MSTCLNSIHTNIIVQLYNEGSAFRSFVRAHARSFVKDQYGLYPNANDSTAPSTAHGVKTFVQSRVTELLTNMAFLCGPLDENVSQSYLYYTH